MDCDSKNKLKIGFNFWKLLPFIALFLLFLIPAYIGLRKAGLGRLISYHVAFMIFFFALWEIKILCSHCPYYAQDGWTLRCNANFGCPKFWQYNPSPMSTAEKVQLILGFAILFVSPPATLFYIGQMNFALLTSFGLFIFGWHLIKYHCAKCVNFSCPFNGVPKEEIDEFLQQNPIMRQAWEEAGWTKSSKKESSAK